MNTFEPLLDVMLCKQCVEDGGYFPEKKCTSGCLAYPLRPSDFYTDPYIWLLRYKLINDCKENKSCVCSICEWKVRVYSMYVCIHVCIIMNYITLYLWISRKEIHPLPPSILCLLKIDFTSQITRNANPLPAVDSKFHFP